MSKGRTELFEKLCKEHGLTPHKRYLDIVHADDCVLCKRGRDFKDNNGNDTKAGKNSLRVIFGGQYLGMLRDGVFYPKGSENEHSDPTTWVTGTKTIMRDLSGRIRKVRPRGKSADPTGEIFEAAMKLLWSPVLDHMEDFTPNGSDAIGADIRGVLKNAMVVDAEKTLPAGSLLYIEFQPTFHQTTNNETERGLIKATNDGAVYIIQTRKDRGIYTPDDLEEVVIKRFKQRRA